MWIVDSKKLSNICTKFCVLRVGSSRTKNLNETEWENVTIKKKLAIAGQDRGSCTFFIQNTKTYQYTWYIAPIDDTDVLRSVAALGS